MRFSILHFSDLHQDTQNEIDNISPARRLMRETDHRQKYR
jgi:hypothetical protein